MAHGDGRLAYWGTIELQSVGVSLAKAGTGVALDLRSNKPAGYIENSDVTKRIRVSAQEGHGAPLTKSGRWVG